MESFESFESFKSFEVTVVTRQKKRKSSASFQQEMEDGAEIRGKCCAYKLNVYDLRYNLMTIKILGFLNILPFDINLSTGPGKIISSKPQKMVSVVNFLWNVFFTVRLLVLNKAVLQVAISKENYSTHLARHCLLLIAAFCMTVLFVSYRRSILADKFNHITLFNGLFKYLHENPDPDQDQNGGRGQGQGQKRSTSSIYDLYLIYAPPIVYPITFIPLVITVMDSESPMLLSSWVVEGAFIKGTMKIHNPNAYILLTLLDLFSWFFIVSYWVYISFFTVLYPMRIKEELERALQSLKMATMRGMGNQAEFIARGIQQAVSSLKVIKFLMLLANKNMSLAVYLEKMICLQCSILSGFVAIKMCNKGNIPLGLMFSVLGIELVVAFIMFFDKVHEIPEKTEQLKKEIMRMAMSTSNSASGKRVKLLKRELWCVQRLGVECGSFCMMEREATLIFLGFVLTQVVNLFLVSNKSHA